MIRPQQFYTAILTRGLTLGGSETTVYVDELPIETSGSLIINPRSSTAREKLTYTGVASSPNSLTGVTRGLAFSTVTGTPIATSRVTANCKRHSAGEVIEMDNGHYEALAIDILNGTSSMQNALDMGTHKITSLDTPTANSDAATKAYADGISTAGAPNADTTTKGIVEQATQSELNAGTDTGGTGAQLFAVPSNIALSIQNSTWTYAADTVGTDSYAITLTPAVTAYVAGQVFVFKAGAANTGASTLAVNALAATPIKKNHDQALEDNDIELGSFCIVAFDGTNFQLLNTQATMPSTAILSEMATFFGATDITGAEAETLTNGSNANALHKHTTSVIAGTRVTDATTASVTYAHGLGVAPSYVRVTTVNAAQIYSTGAYDGTNNKCVISFGAGGSIQSNISYYADGGGSQIGTITAVDATNITISWVKTASPGSITLQLLIESGR